MRGAITAIVQDGGVRAFWRGNGVNVVKVAPELAFRFWIFEQLKRVPFICEDPDNTSMQERFVAGAMAGSLAQAIIYPLEVAKTRIALGTGAQYRSILHCLATVVKNEGFLSLYRGLGASVLGIIPYSGCDLALFSFFQSQFRERWPNEEPGVPTLLLCGAMSTTCAQMVSYPLQLIRTRLQATSKYQGIVDCCVTTLRNEGLRGFYRGLLVNFTKSIPAMSLSWMTFESTKRLLMENAVRRQGARQQQ